MGNVKVTLVTEPDVGFSALYFEGKLIAELGDIDEAARGGFVPIGDALSELFAKPDFDGVDFEEEVRYQKSTKNWTDYGWEYDAEWPMKLSDAPKPPPEYYEQFVQPDGDNRQAGGTTAEDELC